MLCRVCLYESINAFRHQIIYPPSFKFWMRKNCTARCTFDGNMSLIERNFSGLCFFFGMLHANFRHCEYLRIMSFPSYYSLVFSHLKCVSRIAVVATIVAVIVVIIIINWLILLQCANNTSYYISFTFSFHSKFILNRINLMNVCCRCCHHCFAWPNWHGPSASSSLSLYWFITITHHHSSHERAASELIHRVCANFCN